MLVHNAEYETSYGKSSEKLNWDAMVLVERENKGLSILSDIRFKK